MTSSNSLSALLIMSSGVLCYALAYGEKSYYIPAMSVSSLMFSSGITMVVVACIIKIYAQLRSSTPIPWFDFSSDRPVLVQGLALFFFGICIASGDVQFLTGSARPQISSTMAVCVFAVAPVFEGIISIFFGGKTMSFGQIICCLVIIGGIIGYALLEKPETP